LSFVLLQVNLICLGVGCAAFDHHLVLNSFRLTPEGGGRTSSSTVESEKQEKGENQEQQQQQQAEKELQQTPSSKSEKAPKQSGKSWCFCFSCSPCF